MDGEVRQVALWHRVRSVGILAGALVVLIPTVLHDWMGQEITAGTRVLYRSVSGQDWGLGVVQAVVDSRSVTVVWEKREVSTRLGSAGMGGPRGQKIGVRNLTVWPEQQSIFSGRSDDID